MEVTFFVILGVLLLVLIGLGAAAFYKGNKILLSILESLTHIHIDVLKTNVKNAELNAEVLQLSKENARVTSELAALRALNEDLNKSIDILTQQHLS